MHLQELSGFAGGGAAISELYRVRELGGTVYFQQISYVWDVCSHLVHLTGRQNCRNLDRRSLYRVDCVLWDTLNNLSGERGIDLGAKKKKIFMKDRKGSEGLYPFSWVLRATESGYKDLTELFLFFANVLLWWEDSHHWGTNRVYTSTSLFPRGAQWFLSSSITPTGNSG